MSSPIQSPITKVVTDLYTQIAALPDLSPSHTTNQLFERLVALAQSGPDNLIADPDVASILPHLRELAANAENELEATWADRISCAPYPRIELEQFPYYENYVLLAELEIGALRLSNRTKPKTAAFVGSGPLPLSGLLMADKYGLEVTLIERDSVAAAAGQRVIKALAASAVRTVVVAAEDYRNYDKFDLVFLAALVGKDGDQKRQIATHLGTHMRPGSSLIARGAHGARQLLYPEIRPDDLIGFVCETVTYPLNEVINSVVVARKPLGNIKATIQEINDPLTRSRFANFARDYIKSEYGYELRKDWHQDLLKPDAVYEQPRARYWVAEQDGQIVGCIALRPYDGNFAELEGRYGVDTAGIWRFFIRPDYRGRGLEARLLAHAEDFAVAAGYLRLYAHDQSGLMFAFKKYLDNGFEVVAETNDGMGTIHLEKSLERVKS